MSGLGSGGWFVKIGTEVYGPYTLERLRGFVREGRVRGHTLAAPRQDARFAPARDTPELAALIGAEAASAALARGMAEEREENPTEAAQSRLIASAAHQHLPAGRRETEFVGTAWPDAHPRERAPERDADDREAPSAGLRLASFYVACDIDLDGELDFEAALGRFGRFARAKRGLWLLKASTDAETLRNALSRAAGRDGALVIIDASRDRAAWYNIGARSDAALRLLRDEHSQQR